MAKLLKIGVILLLFAALASVRFFEKSLFYDPLLSYFKLGYLDENQLPSLDFWRLFGAICLRFWLNAAISLLVLYVAFSEIAVVKFSLLFYGVVFLILSAAYFFLIFNYEPKRYLSLFYVRRFLIQPIFVIILLPAFYYQSQVRK
ncbi:MAG TPA: exosortase F system-associated protein [Leeuwenhoekiella sp.]|nr:exosortase F system-associated protein [Leeuwenhoekiella sp.]